MPVNLRGRAWWIAALYAIVAALWIYYSDQMLAAIVSDPAELIDWSVYKGFGFVALSSLFLLLLLRRSFGAAERSYQALERIDAQLRASEQQLTAIIGSAMDAIITVDGDERIVLFNQAAEEMFRCPGHAAVGRPLTQFIPDGLCEPPQRRVICTGRCSDGVTIPIEAASSSLEIHEQRFRTLILRDISERQAREHEIERLNSLYSALGRINQAIVRSPSRDPLFRTICHILVEQGGLRMAWIAWQVEGTQRLHPLAWWGTSEDYLSDLQVYADDRPEGRGPTGTAFRSAQPYICNDMLNDPVTLPWRTEAVKRGFEASASLPIRSSGLVQGVLNVYADERGFFQDRELELLTAAVRDIEFALDNFEREAERVRAEVLAQNERRFSDTMIESMPGMLYFYTREGRFLRWNRNFEKVSGYSTAEIAAMSPVDFYDDDARLLVQQRITEVFSRGDSFVEAPFRAKDGTVTPYFFTGRRVDYEGTPCLVGVGIDISERKEAEIALRELNETLESKVIERTRDLEAALVRAEAADRIKSAFLATMSHELRTPLNSILGFTGILLQGLAGDLNPEQAKQLGMVRGSARHLLDLINDVLDLSKIEAGQLQVRAESFDLPGSIERVIAAVGPLAQGKQLRLTSEIGPGLAEMVSDRRRIEQILINLLNNAIKFTDAGSVTLSAHVVGDDRPPDGAAPDGAVRFRVVDTGIGIRPEDLSGLFQPFRQLDSGLAREHDGTGLGLAICRRLANLLGGEVGVTSEWSRGSEFTVVLPLRRSPE